MFAFPALAINWSVFQALGVVPELSRCLCIIYTGKDEKNSFHVTRAKVTLVFFYAAIKVFLKVSLSKNAF